RQAKPVDALLDVPYEESVALAVLVFADETKQQVLNRVDVLILVDHHFVEGLAILARHTLVIAAQDCEPDALEVGEVDGADLMLCRGIAAPKRQDQCAQGRDDGPHAVDVARVLRFRTAKRAARPSPDRNLGPIPKFLGPLDEEGISVLSAF